MKLIYREQHLNSGNTPWTVSLFEITPCFRMLPILTSYNQNNWLDSEGHFDTAKYIANFAYKRVAFPYMYHCIFSNFTKGHYRYFGLPNLLTFCQNEPIEWDSLLLGHSLDPGIECCTPHEYDGMKDVNLDNLCKRVVGLWYGMHNNNTFDYFNRCGGKDLTQILQEKWSSYDKKNGWLVSNDSMTIRVSNDSMTIRDSNGSMTVRDRILKSATERYYLNLQLGSLRG